MSQDQTYTELNVDDLSGKYLTFNIQDAIYGIELMHVIEILSIQSITKIPGVPSYIKGIINLRGRIVPVIDMRLKFNQAEIKYNERTCIIVVELSDMQIGLIVDQVSEVLTIESANLEEIPNSSSLNNNQYLKSIGKINSQLILNIDCEKIFADVDVLL